MEEQIKKLQKENRLLKLTYGKCRDLWTNTAYEVRDRIKGNFERMGYVVKIGGTWWLRITYYDALGIVNNCFNGDVRMTEKRFECDNPLHYRGYGIFDLSKANKTKDDFRDEDGICSYEFHNYLVDETDAMMTGEEVEDLVNKLFDENEQLKSDNKEYKRKINELTAQLKTDEGDDICIKCKHHYLINYPESSKYYISKCEKEHEECSKEYIRFCEDFELELEGDVE